MEVYVWMFKDWTNESRMICWMRVDIFLGRCISKDLGLDGYVI